MIGPLPDLVLGAAVKSVGIPSIQQTSGHDSASSAQITGSLTNVYDILTGCYNIIFSGTLPRAAYPHQVHLSQAGLIRQVEYVYHFIFVIT